MFQTPAAGGDCSGDGSAAGSGPVDVVGTGAGGGGAAVTAASNNAALLQELERFEEARSLLCRTMPVARRVLGKSHEVAIKMLWTYAEMLYEDDHAMLDDLREAVNTLEDSMRGARRIYGSAHPFTKGCEYHLRKSRAALAARETPSPGSA